MSPPSWQQLAFSAGGDLPKSRPAVQCTCTTSCHWKRRGDLPPPRQLDRSTVAIKILCVKLSLFTFLCGVCLLEGPSLMSPGWGAGRVPCRMARGQDMLRDFESHSLVFNHPQGWEGGGKMPVNQRRGRWPQVHHQ